MRAVSCLCARQIAATLSERIQNPAAEMTLQQALRGAVNPSHHFSIHAVGGCNRDSEYKRSEPKENDADRLQLCAQAMCLEEMLLCEIPEGSLFYGETRRRERVALDAPLRESVREIVSQMERLLRAGHTPKARQTKGCNACSLRDICLPRLPGLPGVKAYIDSRLEEGT